MTTIAALRLLNTAKFSRNFRFLINSQGYRHFSSVVTTASRRQKQNFANYRCKCSNSTKTESQSQSEPELDHNTYDKVCSETLESLCEYFEELTEKSTNMTGADIVYGDGVLTVSLGGKYGTYVINRQTPNKQIWLSSPTSGPKRYDFIATKSDCNGKWIYKHTGETLHSLLQQELQEIFTDLRVDCSELPYSS